MGFLARILSWLVRQLTFGVLLVAAGVLGFGAWIYLRDDIQFEQRRLELARALNGQRGQMQAALADTEARLATLRADIAAQELRAREAARLVTELTGLNSGLNRLTTPAEQIRQNEERLARLRATEAEARQRIADWQQTLARAQWEKEGLVNALGRLESQLATVEAQKSRAVDFVREAWERFGWYVVLGAAIALLGPPLARLGIYFVFAPFISRRPPVRLGEERDVLPAMVGTGTALDLPLGPAEVLWIKETYLQSSDEALQRQTRWLLDWRMPLTCLAADLKELVELHNAATSATQRVTLSAQHAAHVELALVEVPAGASLVLRPSFLAGFVGPQGRRAAAIRRHWRLFSLPAWATGRFRYFEFVGPCRLVLAASRGVRVETLGGERGSPAPAARRVNQDATIGFTPGLDYRPVRAETFWAYFRGQNPLFDDQFAGRGVFLVQQNSSPGEAAAERRALARLRDGVLRIFGL